MSHPTMTVAVAQAERAELLREIESPEWRMRSELTFQRRLQRAARLAALRGHLVRALGRHGGPAPSGLREVMTIVRAR